jgi:hypothetical protein
VGQRKARCRLSKLDQLRAELELTDKTIKEVERLLAPHKQKIAELGEGLIELYLHGTDLIIQICDLEEQSENPN